MNKYRLSNAAKLDLIRIHHYGVKHFGFLLADQYYNSFFEQFNLIAQRPFSYEAVDHIKMGYRRCVCGSDSIYFRIENNTVDIMAIVGKQDLSKML
jgi:toxin ParE1/3/4